jgi:putative two-component system response regulator
MKTIFVVDDSDTNLSMAEAALEKQYQVMTMPSAAKMFVLLEKIRPDLILLDIEMPEMDGFETLKLLKINEKWLDIPVIFLTGRNDPKVEVHGFELGAIDFITKPFSEPVFLNRIKTHLDIDDIIHERTQQLNRLQNSIITVLANMVEKRDKDTGDHIERTSAYIRILINEMIKCGLYLDEINKWDIDKIISSARMHDLGKISITDVIVNKKGKLNEDEYEVMKTHVKMGEKIIDEIITQTGEGEFLYNARLFAGYHHERWDGKGYPRGLKEYEIPLQGRIMAIVDVYDALVTERPYKKAFSAEDAIQIIIQSSGTHFDPKISEVFYNSRELLKEIYNEA